MAKLTITDRDLLIDEILARFAKEQPSLEEQWENAVKESGISKELKKYDDYQAKIKALDAQKDEIEDKIKDTFKVLYDKVGAKKDGWQSYRMSTVREHALTKSTQALPSRKAIATAILLSNGGDDMNALMNNVIEQLKNK